MTDENDSHTPDTLDSAGQEAVNHARRQRTRALYHFLDKIDAVIKKRCELLPERPAENKAVGEQPLRQEMQQNPCFDQPITPRGDDELTGLVPVEAPKR
ncbi:hypothetical protein [Metapseudomonas resinovorans]|uniref:Uncharacterized protein n=1 Tax=Metapseudomonas resinovorans NBRC 106553 TaxID=1245471 RepID=S6AM21_METRE|nr:hypothetical protein [Pseudomonas resinovorans]BAN46478.1 hypothetical protein PCA10_07460 [Pseudomonas resinovorans NBRC 106553]